MSSLVLTAIERHRLTHRRRPRLDDLARATNLPSTTVTAVLDDLIATGRVRRGLYDDRSFVDTAERRVPASFYRGHPVASILERTP